MQFYGHMAGQVELGLDFNSIHQLSQIAGTVDNPMQPEFTVWGILTGFFYVPYSSGLTYGSLLDLDKLPMSGWANS
jgi:hypothetical protein